MKMYAFNYTRAFHKDNTKIVEKHRACAIDADRGKRELGKF